MNNNYSHGMAAVIGITALFALLYSIPVAFPSDQYLPWVSEDGIFEWLGTIAFLLASGIFVKLIFSDRKSKNKHGLRTFWLVSLALMCFLAAGEEISWGQRIFGFSTPDAIAESNVQKEMNFHNLKILESRVSEDGTVRKEGIGRWLTFGLLAKLIWMGYLIALPIAFVATNFSKNIINVLRIPVPPLLIAFAGIACYLLSRLLFDYGSIYGDNEINVKISADEIKESIVAFLFLFAAIAIHARRTSAVPVK